MKRIIVTGFEPFDGAEKNASWEAVRELSGIQAVQLPVSFDRAAEMIRELAGQSPDGIICVGEAGARGAISFERVAVNLMDARIPDNDGIKPTDEQIRPGRPAAYFSTLPVREMMKRAQEAGIPAELSYTAGTYVCNAVFYSLMDEIDRQRSEMPGGFIHVPAKGMEIQRIRLVLAKASECLHDI